MEGIGLKMSGKTSFYVVNYIEKGKRIFYLSKNFKNLLQS